MDFHKFENNRYMRWVMERQICPGIIGMGNVVLVVDFQCA